MDESVEGSVNVRIAIILKNMKARDTLQ